MLSEMIELLEVFFSGGLHVPAKAVPDVVQDWAYGVLGKRIQKYELHQAQEVVASMPWHEADREYYQLFKLTPTGATKADFSFYRSGLEGDGVTQSKTIEGKTKIPSGYIMAKAGIYPPRVEIYTSDDAQKFLPSTNIDVSDDELAALYWTRSLKSFARPVFKNSSVYDSLVSKGFMNKGKAITIEGRNILQDSTIQQRIRDMDKSQKYLDRSLYIKNAPSIIAFN
jgi:hypothetical protein